MLLETVNENGETGIVVLTSLLDTVLEMDEEENDTPSSETIASILFLMWKASCLPAIPGTLMTDYRWSNRAYDLMQHPDGLVRQWALVVWATAYFHAPNTCPRVSLDKVVTLLADQKLEVRASAVYTFYMYAINEDRMEAARPAHSSSSLSQAPTHPGFVASAAKALRNEASHLVRGHVVAVIEKLVGKYKAWFELVVWIYMAESVDLPNNPEEAMLLNAVEGWLALDSAQTQQKKDCLSCIREIYISLLNLTEDPDQDVRLFAIEILDQTTEIALQSSLAEHFPILRAVALRLPHSPSGPARDYVAPDHLVLCISTLIIQGRPGPELKQKTDGTSTPDGIRHLPNGVKNWPDRLSHYFHTSRLAVSDIGIFFADIATSRQLTDLYE